jgi:hypothetical protein
MRGVAGLAGRWDDCRAIAATSLNGRTSNVTIAQNGRTKTPHTSQSTGLMESRLWRLMRTLILIGPTPVCKTR